MSREFNRMTTELHLIDAFASGPFTGNPAGVCLLHAPADAAWMQAVAAEMNQAETAFVSLVAGQTAVGLRWFTPAVEVDLCGHATLAAAHVLADRFPVAVRFHTRSGLLTCTRRDDGWIEMDFPATPAEPAAAPAGLLDALGVGPTAVRRSRFDYLVELPSAAAVRAIRPDPRRLAAIDTRGVIVTAVADEAGTDFVSRFFAPAVGVDEDPVTGSAHCCLAPHWAARLGRPGELVGRQLSRRGGVVRCTPAGDRVRLAGRAVTIVRGELTVPAG